MDTRGHLSPRARRGPAAAGHVLLALVLGLAGAAASGCRRAPSPAGPPPLALGAITVDVAIPWGEGPEDGEVAGAGLPRDLAAPDRLRALMRSVLAKDPSVEDAPGAPTARALLVALRPGARGPDLDLDLTAPAGAGVGAWRARVPLAAVAEVGGRRALRAAMVAAWARIADFRRLEGLGAEGLLAAIDDPDAQVAMAAMDLLAGRREARAVPHICARLARGMEPDEVLRGIGTLVAIGDPAAVPTLIDLTLHQEAPFVAQTAFAVGALGGPLAEAYLMTLAAGHPDEAVALAARDALAGRGGEDALP